MQKPMLPQHEVQWFLYKCSLEHQLVTTSKYRHWILRSRDRA